jgi:hypothetical protein
VIAIAAIATLGHAMITRKTVVAFSLTLGLSLVLAAPRTAVAEQQQKQKSNSMWGVDADLKPLMPLPVQPFLPPNSSITAGPAGGSQVQTPLFDPTRDQATPGLRLTIPTR